MSLWSLVVLSHLSVQFGGIFWSNKWRRRGEFFLSSSLPSTEWPQSCILGPYSTKFGKAKFLEDKF